MKFFSFLFFLVSVLTALAEDKVISYDSVAAILTVERSGQLKTFRIKPGAELIVNDVKSPFDKLAPGLRVTLSLADPQTVSRISVQGNQIPKADGRSIVVKMRVDGTDIVYLRDGELTIEHDSFALPIEIFVNGVEWKPKWNGKKTEPFTDFDPPLVPLGSSKPVLKQRAGRSKVAIEKPVPGVAGLAIRIEDSADSTDLYEFRVSW